MSRATHYLAFAAIACAVASGAAAQKFRPETFVKTNDGASACSSKAVLTELMEHIKAGEKTKAEGMFWGRKCVALDAGLRFKVLHVEDQFVEMVGDASGSRDGVWTIAPFLSASP